MENVKKRPGAGLQVIAALICVVIFFALTAGCLMHTAQTMATEQFLGRIIDEVGLYDIALLFAGENTMPDYIYSAVKPEKRADMVINDETLGAVVNSDIVGEIVKTKITQWFDIIRGGSGALVTKEEVRPLIESLEPVLAEHMNCILLEEDYADIDSHLEKMDWGKFRWENLMTNPVLLKLLSLLFNTGVTKILFIVVGVLSGLVCLILIQGIGIAMTHLGVTGLITAAVLGLTGFGLGVAENPFATIGGEIIRRILNEFSELLELKTITCAVVGAVFLIIGIILRCINSKQKQTDHTETRTI